MARRNPKTSSQILGALANWRDTLSGSARSDADALIESMSSDPDMLEAATNVINAKLDARAAKKAADKAEAPRGGSASGGGPLADHEAWGQLADLVDIALTDLTAEERTALKAAFREEARKAT